MLKNTIEEVVKTISLFPLLNFNFWIQSAVEARKLFCAIDIDL